MRPSTPHCTYGHTGLKHHLPADHLIHHPRLKELLHKTLLLPENCHGCAVALNCLEAVGRFDLAVDNETPCLGWRGEGEAQEEGWCRGSNWWRCELPKGTTVPQRNL